MIDHTLLRREATSADVIALCEEANRLGVFAVCVSPTMVKVAVEATDEAVRVAAVCGFPSGAHVAAVKAAEAELAVDTGADEVDMVINLGLVKAGSFATAEREIAGVVAAAAPALVKVIIESAALTDSEIVSCCRAAMAAGAAFVKTSTGCHPGGGASRNAVSLMRATVGPDIGVKASGGIRTVEQAQVMVAAGASRLGCSASASILEGLPE